MFLQGMTILMYAALHGNKELCQDLIERNVNLDKRVCINNDKYPIRIVMIDDGR